MNAPSEPAAGTTLMALAKGERDVDDNQYMNRIFALTATFQEVRMCPTKSSRTLALGLVALAVFSDLGVAQQKGEENTPAAGASSSNSIAPTGPLSNAQLNRIIKNIEERHKQVTLDRDVTNLLGLTKNGEVLTLQHRGIKDSHGIIHTLYLLEGKAGFLLGRRTAEGFTVFHLDGGLNAISGVFNPNKYSDPAVVVPLDESAKKTLYDELLAWADITNQVIDKK